MIRNLKSTHSSAHGFSQVSAPFSFLHKVKTTTCFHCKFVVRFRNGIICLNDRKHGKSYLTTFLLQMHLYAGAASIIIK